MPTIASSNEPHQQRRMAESFGADAERYDRTRPRYPGSMVHAIVAGQALDVLDVGCGTGIAARQFQAAGCTVLGVDSDARMAETARHFGVEVEVATFETWDPAGRAFDTVVAGQAWHWVDAVAGAAKAARVLRPGGRLALFWNVFQLPPGLAEAFAAVYGRVLPDAPIYQRTTPGLETYSPITAKAVDGIEQAAAFDTPEQWQFTWNRPYTRDEWLDQVPTFGGHSQFPQATLDDLLAGMGAAIDEAGGGFTMGYTTVVVTALRAS